MALQALSLRSSSPGIEFAAEHATCNMASTRSDCLINPQMKSLLGAVKKNVSTHPTHSTFPSRDSTVKMPSRKIFGLPAMKFCSFSMGRNRIFRPFEARRSTSSLALRLEARRPGLKLPTQSEGRWDGLCSYPLLISPNLTTLATHSPSPTSEKWPWISASSCFSSSCWLKTPAPPESTSFNNWT